MTTPPSHPLVQAAISRPILQSIAQTCHLRRLSFVGYLTAFFITSVFVLLLYFDDRQALIDFYDVWFKNQISKQ
jgi:hypothetical protein